MAEFSICVKKKLTNAMEKLRSEGLGNAQLSSRDQYDSASFYLLIRTKRQVVAMVRLTPQKLQSVLGDWASDRESIPIGEDIIEATRSVVAKSFRGIGLYKLLMSHLALYVGQFQHVSKTIGAIEPDFPGWRFLQELGFAEFGTAKFVDPPLSRERECRLIVQHHADSQNAVKRISNALIESFEAGPHTFRIEKSFYNLRCFLSLT